MTLYDIALDLVLLAGLIFCVMAVYTDLKRKKLERLYDTFTMGQE